MTVQTPIAVEFAEVFPKRRAAARRGVGERLREDPGQNPGPVDSDAADGCGVPWVMCVTGAVGR